MKTIFAKSGLGLSLAAVGAVVGVCPALGQSRPQAGEIVFVDLGRWTIYEATNVGHCELRLDSGINGSLALRKRAGAPGSLRLVLNNANSAYGSDITFAFDEVQFGGSLMGGNAITPAGDSSALESEFRRAETLTILQGGATVASISLKASSAAYRLLDQCADQWREGFFPPRAIPAITEAPRAPTPSPSITRPEPTPQPAAPVAGAYPPGRAVAAINPSGWIRQSDIGRLPDLRGDGIFTFSLLVNPEGRVEECTVLKSSGSRQLDGQTCRTLQTRARFEPATDANGNPVSATYSSSVQFAASD